MPPLPAFLATLLLALPGCAEVDRLVPTVGAEPPPGGEIAIQVMPPALPDGRYKVTAVTCTAGHCRLEFVPESDSASGGLALPLVTPPEVRALLLRTCPTCAPRQNEGRP